MGLYRLGHVMTRAGRVDEARETLAKLGLRAEVNQLFGGGSSRVYGQSPGAGSRLEPGSVVQLSAL